ncbi:MAG: hypothetical protein WC095_00555 [Candidatus Paceibacterota bacterium]
MEKIKIYLAGQPNEYENNWKENFKNIPGCDIYDWEFDSDQASPDTFFPDDLKAVKDCEYLVANPGVAPSEATWVEIGYFLANNTNNPGDTCNKLIIIWKEERNPKWSIEFIKKAGNVVKTVEEAREKLVELIKQG